MKYRTFTILTLLALLLVSVTPLAAQDDAVECEESFRLFDHELLASDPVCIPEEPQRIAIIDISTLQFALTQGIEPVAVVNSWRDFVMSNNPDISIDIAELTADSVDVGSPVNPEVLLEAEPDLIVAASWIFEGTEFDVDTFQQIAPFVYYEADGVSHSAGVGFVAEALGMPEAGDELVEQYENRVQIFRDLMGDEIETSTISLTRFRGDQIAIFLEGTFAQAIFEEIGLLRPDYQMELDSGAISEEELQLADADYLFLFTADLDAESNAQQQEIIATLGEDPLWSTLSAVQNDRLFVVGSYWQGFGIFEAHRALDDLFFYVVDIDPQEVAPNPFITEDMNDMSEDVEATEEASD